MSFDDLQVGEDIVVYECIGNTLFLCDFGKIKMIDTVFSRVFVGEEDYFWNKDHWEYKGSRRWIRKGLYDGEKNRGMYSLYDQNVID